MNIDRHLDPNPALALQAKPLIEAQAKVRQVASGGAVVQKSAEPPMRTRDELAKRAGVSHDTIAKVVRIKADAREVLKAEAGLNAGNPAFAPVPPAA